MTLNIIKYKLKICSKNNQICNKNNKGKELINNTYHIQN